MSGTIVKEWTDDREGGSGDIHAEKDCCQGGECRWRSNTPAQSEGDKGGGSYPSAPGGDD